MSPTSYQAAPPRDSVRKLALYYRVSRSRTPCRRGRSVRLRKAIQQLLVAAHEAEFLARDPLLKPRIRLHSPLVTAERVDDARQRVDLNPQPPLARALLQQIRRSVLPALDRERDRPGNERHLHDRAKPLGRTSP